ncbi:MAG: hypothetical protein WBD55_04430 [Dehalococcoidia bacterium]
MLGAAWRWWSESWRSPRRARLTYIGMTVAFAALAVVAVVRGEVLAAVLAGIVALVTIALAVLAPRLARRTYPRDDVR